MVFKNTYIYFAFRILQKAPIQNVRLEFSKALFCNFQNFFHARKVFIELIYV